ncbi:hypothetical protein EMIHUDRAFT_203574 [Emiliania huxleyi CCMP1516]|uniref:GATA-type domain-containing protein n=2 Tax=Emiliania huxleyi TaxID=2903 RepID=A0A0D3K2X0_EMIH1|nr:hypothetical protein EMIHUDRAFT_203574 [Emiliania huxleyi CCMP1516]EOD30105.1 hypothetical protein EMIHUDRAFT_203574 [Emiliania huxleyi CCMP1516]|eukprot:XP_005782534.1 hypothetical protein EMIHUDRAFT_203574 [Emiliania huxleyi CCMP1516]
MGAEEIAAAGWLSRPGEMPPSGGAEALAAAPSSEGGVAPQQHHVLDVPARRAAETPTPSAAAARTRATSQTNRGEDAQTEVCPMCGSGMGMATNHGHLPLWLCQKCGYSKRHSERPSWRGAWV